MKFKSNFFRRYLSVGPAALAIERTFECEILSKQEFLRPILDLGCGDGIFASVLFDETVDVGVDPNCVELERAKKNKSYTKLINCYGDNIPLTTGSIKTIFSNSVLEHIENIDAVLCELHRLLAEDGKLYITVPTEKFDQYSLGYQLCSLLGLTSAAQKYKAFYNKFWSHYHYYPVEEWMKLFRRNGFEVVLFKEYASKKVCMLNDALVPVAVDNYFVRKFFKRWFLFPALRKITSIVYFRVINLFIREFESSSPGGLVFFSLVKLPNDEGVLTTGD